MHPDDGSIWTRRDLYLRHQGIHEYQSAPSGFVSIGLFPAAGISDHHCQTVFIARSSHHHPSMSVLHCVRHCLVRRENDRITRARVDFLSSEPIGERATQRS